MIQVQEKSRFSWLFERDSKTAPELWNQEITGTSSFAVVPSLGALVPGWLLVVPRRPMTCLKHLSYAERAELRGLVKVLATKLSKFEPKQFCFEHGSSHSGSVIGCGVDQAHLHIVPLKFDLVTAATQITDSSIDWHTESRFIPLKDLPEESEYVTIWNAQTDEGVTGTVRLPLSQWVRRVIASNLGISDEWDYRTNPQMENVNRTLLTLNQE